MKTKTEKDWRYSEEIALIADSILGSFGADWNRESINSWVARFESDRFSDPLEQAELVDELDNYLTTYAEQLLDDIAQENAISQIHSCYDNHGETFDQYSIVLNEQEGDLYTCLGLSSDPTSPQGFSQFSMAMPGAHLGDKIDFFQLPENIQAHVIERLI